MRYLTSLAKIVVVLVVLAGLSWLLWKEGGMQLAAWRVRNDFALVRWLVVNPDSNHTNACSRRQSRSQLLPSSSPVKLSGYRLRFITTTEYMVEGVCSDNEKEGVLVKKGYLPPGINKIKGSGIYSVIPNYSEALPTFDGAVLISNGLRTYEIGYFENELFSRATDTENWNRIGSQATKTSCEGWGYRCCSDLIEVGSGEAEKRVLDCERSCYPACLSRPQVVFFNTDPVMDSNNRILEIRGPEFPVSFGYEITDPDGIPNIIIIDFGDGQSQSLTEPKGIIDHSYSCSLSNGCIFTASLSVADMDGLSLPESGLNRVIIRQTP